MCKTKNLDFATLMLLIIVAFILSTYIVLAIWYLQNSSYSYINSNPPGDQAPVYKDQIFVSLPKSGQTINNPLTIKGQARGTWYFEASFPVELYDQDNNLLAQSYATAQGDWMTEDWVPFTATLQFQQPATATGWLILQKDNPSGLPQNDDELKILVRF